MSYQNFDDIAVFLQRCRHLFSRFKLTSIFLISNAFLAWLNTNPKTRMFVEDIEQDTQSNVMFVKSETLSFCEVPEEDRVHLFPGNEDVIVCQKGLLALLHQKHSPLIVDVRPGNLHKLFCENCENFCRNESTFDLVVPISNEEFAAKISAAAMAGITHWHFTRENITSTDLKQLAFLVAVFSQVDDTTILDVNKIDITDDCLHDIRSDAGNDFSAVAFSMFRAIAYPSAQEPNRHRLSIDWHLNDPKKEQGYDLYRVDVVDANRSGVSNSGMERLLFAKKDDKRFFVYYTAEHDFVEKTIKERIGRLVDREKKPK